MRSNNRSWDWHDVEKLYVFGRVAGKRSDGTEIRTFPSIRALSERTGISRSVIANRSRRNNWVGERKRFQDLIRAKTWRFLTERELAGTSGSE